MAWDLVSQRKYFCGLFPFSLSEEVTDNLPVLFPSVSVKSNVQATQSSVPFVFNSQIGPSRLLPSSSVTLQQPHHIYSTVDFTGLGFGSTFQQPQQAEIAGLASSKADDTNLVSILGLNCPEEPQMELGNIIGDSDQYASLNSIENSDFCKMLSESMANLQTQQVDSQQANPTDSNAVTSAGQSTLMTYPDSIARLMGGRPEEDNGQQLDSVGSLLNGFINSMHGDENLPSMVDMDLNSFLNQLS